MTLSDWVGVYFAGFAVFGTYAGWWYYETLRQIECWKDSRGWWIGTRASIFPNSENLESAVRLRSWAARALLLVPLWPLVLVLAGPWFLCYGIVVAGEYFCKFVAKIWKDAWS